MSLKKCRYVALFQLSQYLSDNYTTEFWEKCDIMIIIK